MSTHRPGSTIRLAALAVLALVSAACGNDDSDEESASGDTAVAESATSTSSAVTSPTLSSTEETAASTVVASTSTSTSASTIEVTTTTSSPQPEWMVQAAPADCMCADGSPFNFWSRTDDPERIVLYFEGGGACFSAESCAFTSGSYDPTIGPGEDPSNEQGIFDFENPDNPFAGWSVVYVPYCTGDVHIGDATTEYSPDLTVEHSGYPNAEAALNFLIAHYPAAGQVFVTGSSAGGIPSPLFGGLVSDRLPDADIAVLADAAGGYQSDPGVNGAIGALWGTGANIPDWPQTAGVTPESYGVPDLFVFAGQHDPEIRMARFDRAWDETQRAFAAATGTGAVPLPDVLAKNEALVEAGGVDLSVYIAPGDDHIILVSPEVYTLAVEGVPFIDWLTSFVEGEVPGDVRCVDCQPPSSATTTTTAPTETATG